MLLNINIIFAIDVAPSSIDSRKDRSSPATHTIKLDTLDAKREIAGLRPNRVAIKRCCAKQNQFWKRMPVARNPYNSVGCFGRQMQECLPAQARGDCKRCDTKLSKLQTKNARHPEPIRLGWMLWTADVNFNAPAIVPNYGAHTATTNVVRTRYCSNPLVLEITTTDPWQMSRHGRLASSLVRGPLEGTDQHDCIANRELALLCTRH